MRLSAQARERLQEQLHQLRTVALPNARDLIDDSRTAGDIGQNPDYFLAAEEEGNVLAQIKRIEAALEADAKSKDTAVDLTRVQPGVVIALDFGGDVEEFYVGPIEEAGLGMDVLTPTSPMGVAFLGAEVGASASVNGCAVQLVGIREPA
jgi:transcription elongation factor GreA